MLVHENIVYSEIKKKLAKKGISLVLATTDIKHYNNITMSIAKYLTMELGYPGVYISTNLPYATISKEMTEHGINTNLIIFIDAISNISGMEEVRSKYCFYLDSPQNLTDLSIAITEAISAIPTKEKFVIFDSLSTLLIYNSPATVAEFVHFLVSKLRRWSATGVIIAMEKKKSEKLLGHVFKFFDSMIDFTERG